MADTDMSSARKTNANKSNINDDLNSLNTKEVNKKL